MLVLGNIIALLRLLCFSVHASYFGAHIHVLSSDCATADDIIVIEGPYVAGGKACFQSGGNSIDIVDNGRFS
jgi:hypothetical protein